jgi:hypothetical protein
MDGAEISAHAMFSRRFSPPDRPRTRMPPGRAPPTCAAASAPSGAPLGALENHPTLLPARQRGEPGARGNTPQVTG